MRSNISFFKTIWFLLLLLSPFLSVQKSLEASSTVPVQRLLPLLAQAKYQGPDPDLIQAACSQVQAGEMTMPALFLPFEASVTFPPLLLTPNSRFLCFLTSQDKKIDGVLKVSCGTQTWSQHFTAKKGRFSPLSFPIPMQGSQAYSLTIHCLPSKQPALGGIFIGSPLILTPTMHKDRPDIFLLTVDTLSALHMSAYGYREKTTPFFDSLLPDGILFSHAYSPAPWTRPSYASLFTGLPPSIHLALPKKVSHKGCRPGRDILVPALQTLPETLQALGYLTIGIYTVGNLHPDFGFAQGFDLYLNVPEMDTEHHFRPQTARDSANAVLQAIKDFHGLPLFVFVNIIDPHTPYMPPPPYNKKFYHPKKSDNATMPTSFNIGAGCRECSPGLEPNKIIALYDGEVAYTDSELKRIIQGIKQAGLYDQSLILITADHGEELGDHGGWGHGFKLYEEHIRVPFWLRYKPGFSTNMTIKTPVSTMAIYPTILDLLKYPYTPERFWLPSLVPLIRGKGTPPLVLVEMLNHGKALEAEQAIIYGRFKLIYQLSSNKMQFFDLSQDPREKKSLSPEQHKQQYQNLLNNLQEINRQIRKTGKLSPLYLPHVSNNWENNQNLINELKKLGYLE